jgi:hypothetical protein
MPHGFPMVLWRWFGGILSNPKPETRNPKEIQNPKSEDEDPGGDLTLAFDQGISKWETITSAAAQSQIISTRM